MKTKNHKKVGVVFCLVCIIFISGCIQQTPQAVCGNGLCESGETADNCCLDCPCPTGFSCQNNNCMELEKCGNNYCGEGETVDSCCIDCGCPTGFSCTNDRCESICGDGIKASDETSENCCLDAGCSSGLICKDNKCIQLKPVIESSFQPTLESGSVTLLKANGEDIGIITLKNTGNDIAKNIQIKITSSSGYFSEKIISADSLYENDDKDINIDLNFLDDVLNIVSETKLTLNIKIDYTNSANNPYSIENSFEIDVTGRNYFYWYPSEAVSSWVTPSQPLVREFATKATSGLSAGGRNPSTVSQMLAARWIFETFRAYGVNYVNDAHVSGDYIQFPIETLKNKGGDCEDNAILFSSLIEAIGMESVVILVPGHAYSGFVNKEGEIVPIETTASNFDSALYDSIPDDAIIIYPSENWYNYPQVILSEETDFSMPSITKELGDCSVSFSLEKGFYASVPVTFTNSGNAPGAGCAAAITYDSSGNKLGEDLSCWTINPSETKSVDYQPDISISDWLSGYYCSAI